MQAVPKSSVILEAPLQISFSTSSSCMSEKLPVSVHILTWNSGKTLRRTLESIKNCREVILIDGGSTDETLSLAKEFGAKILPQRDHEQGTPLQNFAAARNRGLQHATERWILSVDSDEYTSTKLMEDIKETIEK